jgi:hypothetical protein
MNSIQSASATFFLLMVGLGVVPAHAGVAAPPSPVSVESISQCRSGQFCTWSSSDYYGTFSYVTGSGVTKTLGRTVNSFWNNRTKAARLYNNTGTSYTCYAAGAKRASLSLSYQRPAKLYLSSSTAC